VDSDDSYFVAWALLLLIIGIIGFLVCGCATTQEGQRRLVERHLAMCNDGAGASMWERQACVNRSYVWCQHIGLEPKCVEDSSEPQYSRVP
jgi:hypothetical protein